MYEQALLDAGFTRHQATVYAHLVETGPQTASILARHTGIARTLMYRVLDELSELGLVEKKDEKGAISLFVPAHPIKLHDMVERRKKQADQAAASIGSIVDNMTSEYNKAIGKPGVLFYEGVGGLERVYEDINSIKRDILLIRSIADDDRPEIADAVTRQISRQVALGIHTRVITPLATDTPRTVIEYDADRLVERRIAPRDAISLPAQVLVYGDTKVALTSFQTNLFTTIIDNKDIHDTYVALFEYIWNTSASYDTQVRKTMTGSR